MTDKPDDEQNNKSKPNPFDPESLRLSEDEAGDIDVEPLLTVVEVRKPKRDEFVRVHPEHHAVVPIIELDRDIYLVDASMRNELAGEWKPADMRVAVNRDGTPFLWPVKQAKPGESQSAWHASAKAVATAAEHDWVRAKANMSKGAYDAQKAKGQLEAPVFPDKSFTELLEAGFGDGKLINSIDHPVVKRLRGEE
jgi:hypothetical protein